MVLPRCLSLPSSDCIEVPWWWWGTALTWAERLHGDSWAEYYWIVIQIWEFEMHPLVISMVANSRIGYNFIGAMNCLVHKIWLESAGTSWPHRPLTPSWSRHVLTFLAIVWLLMQFSSVCSIIRPALKYYESALFVDLSYYLTAAFTSAGVIWSGNLFCNITSPARSRIINNLGGQSEVLLTGYPEST